MSQYSIFIAAIPQLVRQANFADLIGGYEETLKAGDDAHINELEEIILKQIIEQDKVIIFLDSNDLLKKILSNPVHIELQKIILLKAVTQGKIDIFLENNNRLLTTILKDLYYIDLIGVLYISAMIQQSSEYDLVLETLSKPEYADNVITALRQLDFDYRLILAEALSRQSEIMMDYHIKLLLSADTDSEAIITYSSILFQIANTNDNFIFLYKLCKATNTWNDQNSISCVSRIISKGAINDFITLLAIDRSMTIRAFGKIKNSKTKTPKQLQPFKEVIGNLTAEDIKAQATLESELENNTEPSSISPFNLQSNPIYNAAAVVTLIEGAALNPAAQAAERIRIIMSADAWYHVDPEILKQYQNVRFSKTPEYQDISSNRIHALRAPHNNPTVGALSGILGIVAAYKIAYSISANNVLFRNAYTKYIEEIKNLSEQELRAIHAKYPDQEQQISAIKKLAKRKQSQAIFYDTLKSGAAGTLIFSLILSFFVGPFALIAAAGGFYITLLISIHNQEILNEKLDMAMQQDITELVKQKMFSFPQNIRPDQTPTKSRLNRLLNAISLSTFSMQTISLGYFGLAAFSPPIFAAFTVITSMVSWRAINAYLKSMLRQPISGLYAVIDPEIEEISLTSNRYSRNKFKKYLLNNIFRVEQIIKQHDLQSHPSVIEDGSFAAFLRPVMSAVGIWESDRFNKALNALYAPNAKAHTELEKLRQECRDIELRHRIEKYWKKQERNLKSEPIPIEELQKQHGERSSKVIQNYLKDAAAKEVNKIVTRTGLSTTAAVAIIAISLAFFVSPLGVYALALGGAIMAVGYVATKLAAYHESKKMRKALLQVPEADMENIVAYCKDRLQTASQCLCNNITVEMQHKDQEHAKAHNTEDEPEIVLVEEPTSQNKQSYTADKKPSMTFPKGNGPAATDNDKDIGTGPSSRPDL